MQIIYTTVPSREVALSLIKKLLEKKLIACANFFPIESVYRWEGKLTEDKEYTLLLKTNSVALSLLEKEIAENHPYDIPCIMQLDAEAGSLFGEWVDQQLQ